MTFEEINFIDSDFYKLFEGKNGIETNKTYKLKKELQKYVIHAIYSHDIAYNDSNLTFEQFCKKYKFIN